MKHLEELSQYQEAGAAVLTIGKFDGLHLGHQVLLQKVNQLAREQHLLRVMCAIDFTPFWEQNQITPALLMTKAERREKTAASLDYLLECPFDQAFMEMGAEAFVARVIGATFHARIVVVGEDFRFGRGQSGDTKLLKQLEHRYGYKTVVLPKKRYLDNTISSTYIKNLIRGGEISLANTLLGYAYSYTGVVAHGNRLGRTLGFPTINVYPAPEKVLPPFGVYYDRVCLDGKYYPGIANVGVKPTIISNTDILIESFMFGYDGDAYDKEVTIEIVEFRRPEQKFADLAAMKAQIDTDIAAAKAYFA